MGDIAGKTVLDVGAGHGQNVRAVAGSGAVYTAYASSEQCFGALRKAVESSGMKESEINYQWGELHRLPFPDRSFDAVVSFRIISHVPDWRLFLMELCRVSAGRVIIDFAPGASCFFIKLLSLLKGRVEPASREFTTQRLKEIEKVAERAGFKGCGSEGEFVLPMVFHRMSRGLFFPVERAASGLKITRFAGGPVIAAFERKGGGGKA